MGSRAINPGHRATHRNQPLVHFRNESGALDLPSIVVGVVGVGILTAGVLAVIFSTTDQKAAMQVEALARDQPTASAAALTAMPSLSSWRTTRTLVWTVSGFGGCFAELHSPGFRCHDAGAHRSLMSSRSYSAKVANRPS